MSFVTDGELKQAIADELKKAVGDLSTYWDRLATRGNAFAYNEIVGTLVNRGYTKAVIDTWDRGEEFQIDLGIWWCLTRGAGLEGFDSSYIGMYDRRQELLTIIVFVSGSPVYPTLGGMGLVTTSGPMDDTGIFRWPDPDDPNLGEYTRW